MPLARRPVRNGTESSKTRTCWRRSSMSLRTRVSTSSGVGSIPHASNVCATESATESVPRSRSVLVFIHPASQRSESTPAKAATSRRRVSNREFTIVSYTSTRHPRTIGSGLPELVVEQAELVVAEAVVGQPLGQAAVPDVQLLEERLHRPGARQV